MDQQVITADICDRFPDKVRAIPSIFKNFGSVKAGYGEVATVRLHDSNEPLFEKLVREDGTGRILLVDVWSKNIGAVIGGRLSKFAAEHNWQGIIVNGYIRDILEISENNIAVFALGTCPTRIFGENLAFMVQVPVEIHTFTIIPGCFAYFDEDGIVFSDFNLL